MAHRRRTFPAEVVKAQADCEHWRTHRQGNEPIPDELWQVAAAAAHHRGLSLVSRVLRLNDTKLKQCLLAQQPPASVMSPILIRLLTVRERGICSCRCSTQRS